MTVCCVLPRRDPEMSLSASPAPPPVARHRLTWAETCQRRKAWTGTPESTAAAVLHQHPTNQLMLGSCLVHITPANRAVGRGHEDSTPRADGSSSRAAGSGPGTWSRGGSAATCARGSRAAALPPRPSWCAPAHHPAGPTRTNAAGHPERADRLSKVHWAEQRPTGCRNAHCPRNSARRRGEGGPAPAGPSRPRAPPAQQTRSPDAPAPPARSGRRCRCRAVAAAGRPTRRRGRRWLRSRRP